MAKSNIRSFRYSDDVSKILENFAGNSLNDKFENLVMFCFHELPKIKNSKKQIEKQIDELQEKRKVLYESINLLADELKDIKQAKGELLQIGIQCLNIRERISKICNTELEPG